MFYFSKTLMENIMDYDIKKDFHVLKMLGLLMMLLTSANQQTDMGVI